MLELNRHQVNDDARSNRKSKRDSWLTDTQAASATAGDQNASISTAVPKYPWNAQALRITLLTRDYAERETLDPTFM